MTPTAVLTGHITATDYSAGLGCEVWFDTTKIFDKNSIVEPEYFEYAINDTDGEHQLQFVLKNKSINHTELDADGKIVNDVCLIISKVAFDGIELSQLLYDNSEYSHNFNGTSADTTQKFFGEMGCNGVVTFKFTTPTYLWLLERI